MSGKIVRRPAVVLVLGKAGVGKSTFIRAATGLEVQVGDNLHACTQEVQIYPVPNTTTFLIDTPGFNGREGGDAAVLQSIASCLADLHEGLLFEGQINLHGVVYVHSIRDPRMPGTMMQNLNIFRSLVGREHMDHCVLLTTKWGSVKNEQYDAREGELIHKTEFWRNNIKDGAITMRFGGSRQSALEVLTCATQQASFLPRISQEYIVNGSALIDTAAGRAINTDLEEIRATHVDSLASIRSEYSEVLEANYIDTTASMKGLYATTEKKIQEVAEELRSLSYSREAEQRRLDHIEMVDFSLSTHETPGDRESDRESELLARRKKRALRWFVRFAGLGVVVVTTALTHGAMAPVGVGLMVSIESVLQAAKANERDDWRLKKY